MLTVPPTIPSRCTMRLTGSSTVGVGFTGGMGGVTIGGVGVVVSGVVVGFPVGGWMGGAVASTTTLLVGTGGGVAAMAPGVWGASKCAATKAYEFAGASISAQSPLALRAFTASPLCNIPTTL